MLNFDGAKLVQRKLAAHARLHHRMLKQRQGGNDLATERSQLLRDRARRGLHLQPWRS